MARKRKRKDEGVLKQHANVNAYVNRGIFWSSVAVPKPCKTLGDNLRTYHSWKNGFLSYCALPFTARCNGLAAASRQNMAKCHGSANSRCAAAQPGHGQAWRRHRRQAVATTSNWQHPKIGKPILPNSTRFYGSRWMLKKTMKTGFCFFFWLERVLFL